jgi:hypothetical protein
MPFRAADDPTDAASILGKRAPSLPASERLAVLWEDFSAVTGALKNRVSPATFRDWRRRSLTFEAIAAYAGRDIDLAEALRIGRAHSCEPCEATAGIFTAHSSRPNPCVCSGWPGRRNIQTNGTVFRANQ